MEGDNTRAHVVIHGRVQGVFFRAETRKAAEQIGGITGWVKNRPDGTVEAVFEGNASAVDQMLAWCKTGPPMARVTDLEVTKEPFRGAFDRFDISY